jgi:hypothetical protein
MHGLVGTALAVSGVLNAAQFASDRYDFRHLARY